MSLKALVDGLDALDVNVERDARMDEARQEIQRAIHNFAALGRVRRERGMDPFAAVDANGGVGPGADAAREGANGVGPEIVEEEAAEELNIADSAKVRAILEELAEIRDDPDRPPGPNPSSAWFSRSLPSFWTSSGPRSRPPGTRHSASTARSRSRNEPPSSASFAPAKPASFWCR